MQVTTLIKRRENVMFISIGHWVNSDGLSEPFTVETEYDDKDLIEKIVKETYLLLKCTLSKLKNYSKMIYNCDGYWDDDKGLSQVQHSI